MTNYVTIIDKLPLTPVNKISIVQVYVFSKLRWRFSMYNLTETWVDRNIDKIISKFVRKWCQLPVCANVEHLSFPLSKLGVNFKSAKMCIQSVQIVNASNMKTVKESRNPKALHSYVIQAS